MKSQNAVYPHDFTDKEWELLLKGPAVILTYIETYKPSSMSDRQTFNTYVLIANKIHHLQYPKE